MSRCLVVGGGFLGAHIAEGLAALGEHVIVYSRSFNEWLLQEDRSGPGTIELMEGVVPPGTGLREVIAECDVVYYLAGSGTPAEAKTDPGGSIIRSVVPAAAVLDLMRGTSTRRVVIASSGGTVYGRARHLPTDETEPAEPISIHGHNSLSVERYALFYAEHHGLEPVILRYANPYGPGQLVRRGQGVIAAWCEAIGRDEPILVYGSLDVRRDFLYISDAASATMIAGSGALPLGVFNVGSGTSHTLGEVIEMIERAAGRRARIERVDARGIDVPATQLDCTRLRSSTGWQPKVGLAEGIVATLKWTSSLAYPRTTL